MSRRSKEDEIQVLETQWNIDGHCFYAENDRVVRKHFQLFCALGANFLLFCFGLIFPQSGFLLPQLQDPVHGFGIDQEQGSWFGNKHKTFPCTSLCFCHYFLIIANFFCTSPLYT